MGMGLLVYLCLFAGCIALYNLFTTAKTTVRKIFIISCFIIYLIGFAIANDAIAEACTHGHCRHGWYSKSNTFEKFMALLWTLTPWLFFTKQIGNYLNICRLKTTQKNNS